MTNAGQAQTSPHDLDGHLREIERLEELFKGWDEAQQSAVKAYTASIESLHKEAVRRLIKNLSREPAALDALKETLGDEIVYAVLRRFEIVKPSLQERVEQALDTVRPMLASHGGDVELVAVTPPDTADVRFLGACDGCPASMLTFVAGVKKAIEEHCPEITTINQAKGMFDAASTDPNAVKFISPFSIGHSADWRFAISLSDLPEGRVTRLSLDGEDVLLSRNSQVVSCFQNACAHMGMPIHEGPVRDGIIVCPHHNFEYDLKSGECLTAPEVQLQAHAVRVIGNRVEVRLAK